MGLDEAGRGCLAGPVVASGVILKPDHEINDIKDSKKISPKERTRLAYIIKKEALVWRVAWGTPEEIDEYNILQASLMAMQKCVEKTAPPPDFLLIDGNKKIKLSTIAGEAIVGGDARSPSIGAASILAKVTRDLWMERLHLRYPEYGWNKNRGYPTAVHYEALQQYGITPWHRQSFRLDTEKRYLLK